MPLSLNASSVNNLVNNLFKMNGRDPYSQTKAEGFKVSDGVKKQFGDTFISAAQLKNTINDSYSHVALSLRDQTHPWAASDVASIVSQGLDGADGSRDGMISVNDSSRFFGKSAISPNELALLMSQGQIVLGEGGKLMSREEALAHGDTIIAVHENKAGPTIALDR